MKNNIKSLHRINFIENKKSQMHVVMAIMLIAILLASMIFFWRTSQTFSKSYSEEIDKKSFENVASYIENVIGYNEIAWIERTLVETSIIIPLKQINLNDNTYFVGENELFKVEYDTDWAYIRVYPKKENGDIVTNLDIEEHNVILNGRFYVDGAYTIYSNPTNSTLMDKNVMGDFLFFRMDKKPSGSLQDQIVYLTPTFKSAVIGDAGRPPESLAKCCFLLEYPKKEWGQYFDSRTNTYSVYPFNYYIINADAYGIDKRYVGYFTNIIVPSNSTMLDALSDFNTKQILNDYVKDGGSLILLSQYNDERTKYDFLPISVIFDGGKYDTIGVSKQHNITSNLLAYEISGSYYSAEATISDPYFDGPNTEILIREIPYNNKNNSNPSLIISNWGAGKIVATTIPIDVKALIDCNTSVCPWWDPSSLGAGEDWHFRKLVVVNSGSITRINEPIKVIIDPTVEINRLAKEGFLDLETTNLDFNSIRVVELVNGDCNNPVEIPSQSYPFRPNLEEAGYRAVPTEFHEHTIFFELDESKDLRLEMEIPLGAQHKDEPSPGINTDFNVTINDVPVKELLLHLPPAATPTMTPGYWDPYDGGPNDGPDRYSVVLPQKYFHKGQNKIRLRMDVPDNGTLTWYQNVVFRLYERRAPNPDLLFWQEYPPLHVYFVMGATEQTQGITHSRTIPGQNRYYYIYFDIEENGKKLIIPSYRNRDDSHSQKWSIQLDNQNSFKETVFLNPHGITLLQNYFPVFMNVSSPSSGDINDDGIIDIVTGLRDGNVTAIKGTDGSLIWKSAIIPNTTPIKDFPNYKVYAGLVGSPTIGDINHDNALEVIVGGAKVESIFNDNTKIMTINTLASTVSILDGETGNLLRSLPIDGALMSSPILADINKDGYDDIILVDTRIQNLGYNANTKAFTNNPTISNKLYVFSGSNGNIIFSQSISQTYDARFFGRVVGNVIEFMIPNSSPTVGHLNGDGNMDSKGDGELDVVWGAIDGTVRAYRGNRDLAGNFSLIPLWNRILGFPNVIPNPRAPLSYICSSPAIAQANYRNDYDDVIISNVHTGNDNNNRIFTVMLDGSNGTIIYRNGFSNANDARVNSRANEISGGHPVIHSPDGQSHRGPQIFVPAGSNIKVAHLDGTHIVQDEAINGGWGSIPQINHSYATPVIVEINNYTTFMRDNDSFFSDILLGNENGILYCHSYRDTDQGSQNAIVNNWQYTTNPQSPIRSAVVVDDIDNDGKSEIIFMTFDGRLISLDAASNYTKWSFNRHDLFGTANTLTNLNPVINRISDIEGIDFKADSDPYNDKFVFLSEFTIGSPSSSQNIFNSYFTDSWIKIDTNKNMDINDERAIYNNELIQLNIDTYEGRNVERTFALESIYGDIINNKYLLTFYDRGIIKLFNNIMAYTSAPTKNIQIEEGIWISLDIPSKIGGRDYVIQGLGDRLRIYDPNNPQIEHIRTTRGVKIYGTIAGSSKNKYVVITSYGAYLSPNPSEV